ncbi:MAG: hypothetical protein B7Z20_05375, partial [Sphingobium sp. 32-64-5]
MKIAISSSARRASGGDSVAGAAVSAETGTTGSRADSGGGSVTAIRPQDEGVAHVPGLAVDAPLEPSLVETSWTRVTQLVRDLPHRTLVVLLTALEPTAVAAGLL